MLELTTRYARGRVVSLDIGQQLAVSTSGTAAASQRVFKWIQVSSFWFWRAHVHCSLRFLLLADRTVFLLLFPPQIPLLGRQEWIQVGLSEMLLYSALLIKLPLTSCQLKQLNFLSVLYSINTMFPTKELMLPGVFFISFIYFFAPFCINSREILNPTMLEIFPCSGISDSSHPVSVCFHWMPILFFFS